MSVEVAVPLPAKQAGQRDSWAQPRSIAGRALEILTVFALLFVLQSGLAPFDFGATGKRALAYFEVDNPSWPDRISNVALYIPVAFLVYLTLCRRVRAKSVSAALTISGLLLVSVLIELLQHYSPVRVSSFIDTVCNTLGTILGVFLATVLQVLAPRRLDRAARDLQRRAQATALKAYCGVLIVFAVLPFTFSLERSRLRDQYDSAVFVPFATAASQSAAVQADSGPTKIDHAQIAQMKRWSRWFAEAISFLLLGWLLLPFLRHDYGFARVQATALTLWLGGLVGVTLSVLQFTVISRGLDVTDVVFRFGGLLLGVLTHSACSPWAADRELSRTLRLERWRGVVALGLAGCAGFVVYNGLIPFRFDFAAGRFPSALVSDAVVPFVSYFVSRFDHMTADVIEKLTAYAILAGLVPIYLTLWQAAQGADMRAGAAAGGERTCHGIRSDCAPSRLHGKRLPVTVVLACVGLSAVIECLQAFLPVRIPTATDLIVAGSGAVIGLLGHQVAVHFHAAMTQAPTTTARRRSRGALGPMDELIASIAEPLESAPAEPGFAREAPATDPNR